MDVEKLAAFALVSGITSLIPGPSMLFVMGQAIWRGGRAGATALAGVQAGYVVWWCLAALGLGVLAEAFPLAFRVLAIGGALYLAWLGLQALRQSGQTREPSHASAGKPSSRAFCDGIFVAIGNPKALIYIVALLPPFVDAGAPIVPQLMVLAAVAMAIDVALGLLYILAGNRLGRVISRRGTRVWLDRVVGVIFLAVALGILVDLISDAGAG